MVLAMQPADVLGERALPRDRHSQEQRVEGSVVKTLGAAGDQLEADG